MANPDDAHRIAEPLLRWTVVCLLVFALVIVALWRDGRRAKAAREVSHRGTDRGPERSIK